MSCYWGSNTPEPTQNHFSCPPGLVPVACEGSPLRQAGPFLGWRTGRALPPAHALHPPGSSYPPVLCAPPLGPILQDKAPAPHLPLPPGAQAQWGLLPPSSPSSSCHTLSGKLPGEVSVSLELSRPWALLPQPYHRRNLTSHVTPCPASSSSGTGRGHPGWLRVSEPSGWRREGEHGGGCCLPAPLREVMRMLPPRGRTGLL